MTTSRCPRTATTMTRVSTLLSHSKRILHFAAVRSIPLFCLLVVLVVHFVVLLIGSQCWPPAHKAQRNDLDVHTTSEIFFIRTVNLFTLDNSKQTAPPPLCISDASLVFFNCSRVFFSLPILISQYYSVKIIISHVRVIVRRVVS